MRTAIRTTALAISLAVLTACAGETSSPLTDGTPAPATETGTEAAGDGGDDEAAQATTDAVDIDDFRFKPETITVTAGTEVTWTNQDDTAHTVTAGSEDAPEPEEFDLDVGAAGDTVSTTFDEPGEYPYFCELHPFMTGTVEVTG